MEEVGSYSDQLSKWKIRNWTKKWNDILKRYVNNFHTYEINKISNILS